MGTYGSKEWKVLYPIFARASDSQTNRVESVKHMAPKKKAAAIEPLQVGSQSLVSLMTLPSLVDSKSVKFDVESPAGPASLSKAPKMEAVKVPTLTAKGKLYAGGIPYM